MCVYVAGLQRGKVAGWRERHRCNSATLQLQCVRLPRHRWFGYNQLMTTMTRELPAQLAAEIEPMRDELPVLIAITRQLFRPVSDARAHSSPVYLAYKQLLDFLANSPTPDAINRFTISAQAQSRVHWLLDKHGEGEIDQEDQAELRVYSQINEIMGLKKAQAILALAHKE